MYQMIKYIYYRLCKHHEKGKRKNVSNSIAASRYPGMVNFMMVWPFAFLFMVLMKSSNQITMWLGFLPFVILSLYLGNRFEKKMQNYKPPKRYKALNQISIYWLTIPAALLFTAYFIAVIVFLMKYVIVPYNLEGWLYNLLFS